MHDNNSLIDRIYRRLSNVPMWVCLLYTSDAADE